MANIIITGSQFAFASTYGTATNVTAATNVANAVLTLAAGHGTVVGDFLEVLASGWGRAEGRVFRASNVSTNDVTFEGLDTTDTNLFPAGGAVGSTVRRITAWTGLTQVGREIDISGNELETADATYVTDLQRKSVPIFRSPVNVTLPIFFDPSLPWVSAARAVSNANAVRALRA
ncbi:MAG: phage tail protein, partial [Phycisphaerales bacterium]|nr:phage tail protein [Phycisphaerales bacterium]